MKRLRLEIGDVFTLPLDSARVGLGQVVGKYRKDGYYFAIFAKAHPLSPLPKPSAIADDEVALLALSLDAKLWVGDWKIIGRAPVAEGLPFPAYRLMVDAPDSVFVVDYTGDRRQRASRLEAERLPYRATVAPVRLEKAFRALNGLEPWNHVYDELRPTDLTTSSLFD